MIRIHEFISMCLYIRILMNQYWRYLSSFGDCANVMYLKIFMFAGGLYEVHIGAFWFSVDHSNNLKFFCCMGICRVRVFTPLKCGLKLCLAHVDGNLSLKLNCSRVKVKLVLSVMIATELQSGLANIANELQAAAAHV